MFENPELASWLEEAVRLFIQQDADCKVDCGAMVLRQENGNVMTGYLNCDATDKAILAFNIVADAMLDVVCNNADRVRAALDELEEGEEWEQGT